MLDYIFNGFLSVWYEPWSQGCECRPSVPCSEHRTIFADFLFYTGVKITEHYPRESIISCMSAVSKAGKQ